MKPIAEAADKSRSEPGQETGASTEKTDSTTTPSSGKSNRRGRRGGRRRRRPDQNRDASQEKSAQTENQGSNDEPAKQDQAPRPAVSEQKTESVTSYPGEATVKKEIVENNTPVTKAASEINPGSEIQRHIKPEGSGSALPAIVTPTPPAVISGSVHNEQPVQARPVTPH